MTQGPCARVLEGEGCQGKRGGGDGTNDQCVRVDAPGHKFLQLGMLGTQSMFIVLLADELASFSRLRGWYVYMFPGILCAELSK